MRRAAAALALLLLASGASSSCSQGPPSSSQTVAGGDAERGARWIAHYGCGSCHDIPGIPGAHGRVGPPLEAFAERAYIAGKLRNEPDTLVRWIRFPQYMDPGTVMPDLGVTEPHARDIAAYLYTLSAGGLGPPRLFPPQTLPVH